MIHLPKRKVSSKVLADQGLYWVVSYLFLLFLLFFLSWCFLTTVFLTLGGFGISSLLAWPFSEPLGKLLCWPLGPFIVLLFPDGVKGFCSDDFPSTFVQLFPVLISSGVCSAFILGVHADHWWVFSDEGFRVKTLLESLLSELSLLPFLEFFEFKLLSEFSLFIVVFVLFELDNDVEDFVGLGFQFIGVHGIEFKRLQSDAEGNLLLFLKLFLGLGHFSSGISTTSSGFLLVSSFLSSLLGFEHFLTLSLGLLKALLLFFGFFCLFLIFFFSELFFLFLLLLVEFLFLLSSDLLPLGLLLLQLCKLLLLGSPGFSPFCDVLFQL